MVMPLSRPLAVVNSLNAEVEIRHWSDQDYQLAAAVITTAYRGHVDSQINDQYRSLSGSLRFLNNIVRFPGCGTFDSDSSFVAVHMGARKVIGLILRSPVLHDLGPVNHDCVVPR